MHGLSSTAAAAAQGGSGLARVGLQPLLVTGSPPPHTPPASQLVRHALGMARVLAIVCVCLHGLSPAHAASRTEARPKPWVTVAPDETASSPRFLQVSRQATDPTSSEGRAPALPDAAAGDAASQGPAPVLASSPALSPTSLARLERHLGFERRLDASTPVTPWWMAWCKWTFAAIVVLLVAYTARHWLFTMNRMHMRTVAPYIDIQDADWPEVTIFVAAHNEEAVIAGCLEALMDVSYPADRLHIVPVNDRSKDRTREIIDAMVERYPGRIKPFHRTDGKPGKAAALKDAMVHVRGDILIVFDADYIPGRGLIKQLVAPFFDPEVGAVMGRVVPMNAATNLLTRLLDLERSAGYQVDQQARMNLNLVPQYGGTVGGIRMSAMAAAGGWHDDVLAEDTDITYRLLIKGWRTVYQNRSECYEEVPEAWPVRIRQIKRWSKGHNQAMVRHFWALWRAPLPWRTRIDGAFLLGVFIMPPILILGAALTLVLYFSNVTFLSQAFLALFSVTLLSTLGNFAAFFEIAAAVKLDGNNRRIRLLPLNILGFAISCTSIAHATWDLFWHDWIRGRELVWDKTVRYRAAPPAPATPAPTSGMPGSSGAPAPASPTDGFPNGGPTP